MGRDLRTHRRPHRHHQLRRTGRYLRDYIRPTWPELEFRTSPPLRGAISRGTSSPTTRSSTSPPSGCARTFRRSVRSGARTGCGATASRWQRASTARTTSASPMPPPRALCHRDTRSGLLSVRTAPGSPKATHPTSRCTSTTDCATPSTRRSEGGAVDKNETRRTRTGGTAWGMVPWQPGAAVVDAGDVGHWFGAFQRDLAARLRWTVTPEFGDANHAPRIVTPQATSPSPQGNASRSRSPSPTRTATTVLGDGFARSRASMSLSRSFAQRSLHRSSSPDAPSQSDIHIIVQAVDHGYQH